MKDGDIADAEKYDPSIIVDDQTRRTPFVKHTTKTGITFSCIYSGEKQIALVAIFTDPKSLDTSRSVPVRLHSSCANSDILDSLDCDCRSQLVRSIEILREKNGVLLHLFQEGRGAGIFSKYLGMYTMQSKCVNTYEAYRELDIDIDGRDYALAFKILKDLGIEDISLLSNNPKKASAFEEAGFSVKTEPLFGQITPQNFGYLYTKFSEGNHKMQDLFPEKNDYFLCETNSSPGSYRRAWIIDGDDTLWEDNIVYTRLINSFIEHCLPFLLQRTEQQVRDLIDEVEEMTIKEEGFGAYGFQRSLEKVCDILTIENPDLARPVALLDSIVPTLRNQPETLVPEAATVLSELHNRKERLVLYTQGPLAIQFEKISRSGLAEYFDVLCVVNLKNADSLERLRKDLGPNSGEFIMVGNSLRSDIEPALEAGLSAIYFNNPNSWHLQNISTLNPAQYTSISKLSQLLDLTI